MHRLDLCCQAAWLGATKDLNKSVLNAKPRLALPLTRVSRPQTSPDIKAGGFYLGAQVDP